MTLPRRHRTGVAMALAAALYAGLLAVAYLDVISPAYSYLGYVSSSPAAWELLVCVVLAAAPAPLMPLALERPSQLVTWGLYLLAYVPALVVPALAISTRHGELLLFDATLLVAMLGIVAVGRRAPPRIPQVEIPVTVFWAGLLAFAGIAYLYVFASFGLHRPAGLGDVYTVRASYKAELAGHRPAPYLIDVLGNVVNPILIAWGLIHRRRLIVAAAVAGQAYLYSVTAFKALVFSPLLIFAVYLLTRRGTRTFGRRLLYGGVGLVGVAYLLETLLGIEGPLNLVVRRVIVTPGLLSGYYWNFFVDQDKALLAHSFLGHFLAYPYPLEPPRLIGYVYFRTGTDANANVWADAFVNFGYVGILAFTALLAAVMSVLDAVARNVSRLAALAVVPLTVTLTNSSLFTTLGTHGLLFALVALYFMPRADALRLAPASSATPRPVREVTTRRRFGLAIALAVPAVVALTLVSSLHGRIDAANGRDYGSVAARVTTSRSPQNAAVHAYRLAALARLYAARPRRTRLRRMRIEGRWLLSHADLNRNRVQGYGVPYSAAVVAGGSPAPANTERTDIGAVALQGLLDWSAADRRAPHGAIRRRVLGVLRPYLTGNALSPSGMIAASSRPLDRLVEAPAPAAAMAAVMQRAGRTVGSRTTRGAIRFIGRQTARVLVFLHRTDGSGAWYWPAADGTAEPESLLASAVTGSGLVSYLRHGGRITPRVAPDMLTGRLAEFARRRDLGWLEVARDAPSPERSDRSAGLAALGAALQVAGDTRETTFYRPLIMRAIRAEESKAKGRRPAPLDGLLLLGLSDALSAEK